MLAQPVLLCFIIVARPPDWNLAKLSRHYLSEEHAREYRRTHHQPGGTHPTLGQAAVAGRIAQSGLFAFGPYGWRH
jgi:hypothetical protein